jgi:hypothetical protein
VLLASHEVEHARVLATREVVIDAGQAQLDVAPGTSAREPRMRQS